MNLDTTHTDWHPRDTPAHLAAAIARVADAHGIPERARMAADVPERTHATTDPCGGRTDAYKANTRVERGADEMTVKGAGR